MIIPSNSKQNTIYHMYSATRNFKQTSSHRSLPLLKHEDPSNTECSRVASKITDHVISQTLNDRFRRNYA